MASFEQYNKWRDSLIAQIDRVAEATKDISPEKSALYSQIGKQLRDDSLKIQVVGTVKNGKSSFTNAILGESILPVDDIPCTAVVSEVKYGPTKKAVVNFCSPLPTGLLDEIPAETKQYIQNHNLGKDAKGDNVQIPPLEVPYDAMNHYVAIPEPTDDILFNEEALRQYRTKIDQESPFDVARLYYPSAVLEDGVELVDSPGLNESPKRTAVTLDYLRKADAAIYLLDATHPATSEEKKVIEQVLLPLGFNDLIMVANRIDLVERRERQLRYCQGQVQEYTSVKKCFGVSAKEFLTGAKNGDEALKTQSGIPAFMAFLTDYLTTKKADLKISKSANQLINSITAEFLQGIIPARLEALDADSRTIQKRINDATPKLTALEAKREEMALAFDRNIPLALTPVKESIVAFFNKLEQQIPQWIAEFSPKHDCGMYANKSDLEIVSEEIIEHTKAKVDEVFKTWNEETFQPIIVEQSDLVFGNLEADMKDMADDIAVIENMLKGVSSSDINSSSVTERMLGIAAIALLPMGRAGGNIYSGGFDISRFIKDFAIDLGALLGVGLVMWIWPPLGFIALIASVISGLFNGTKRRIEKLKTDISNEVVKGIHDETPARVAEILDKTREMFESIRDSVLQGLDSEIATASAQLEELRRLTSDEQDSIDRKRSQIKELENTLTSSVEDMQALVASVKEASAEPKEA